MSQIDDLLGMNKKHRDAGVIGALLMYSWVGLRIQPL
jgi:hypothetical protein